MGSGPLTGFPAREEPQPGGSAAADPKSARSRFEELSKLYQERAWKLVRLRLGAKLRRRVDSQDVLQDSLLDAARLFIERGAAATVGNDKFFAWLACIIESRISALRRFHVTARRRTLDRQVRLGSEEWKAQAERGGKTPSAVLQAEELCEALRQGISHLSAREQEVVELVCLRRLRVAEAAGVLGKTRNSTSVLLCQALKRLRAVMKEKER